MPVRHLKGGHPWRAILLSTRDIEHRSDCIKPKEKTHSRSFTDESNLKNHSTKETMSDQTREKATLFVGGLDNQVTAQTLHDAFIPFGEIADISLPKPDL
jgi:RNA recognition motif-containing protein